MHPLEKQVDDLAERFREQSEQLQREMETSLKLMVLLLAFISFVCGYALGAL